MKNPERIISKLVESALRRYSMIAEGDRILVAVSGGKDSTTLAYDLAMKRSWWPDRFEVRAVHIASDFCSCCKKTRLTSLLEEWGLPYESVFVPIIGRLKPGRSMNCYWCSTQRRTELLRYAEANGFNKIALGHHLDDIIETFFMNMMDKAELLTMLPVLKYDLYPVSIIRPLALCEERQIEEFADYKEFRSAACTCPYGASSKRRSVRSRLAAMTGGSSSAKRNIYESMSNISSGYLPVENPLPGSRVRTNRQ